MTVAGICMVKDEIDVIEATITHMLTQVDYVYVLDNGSTDGTSDLLAKLDIDVQRDDEVGYYQSRKMSVLAQRAAVEVGADWVVPFDADELWYSPFGRIGDVLESLDDQFYIAPAALYDHVATSLDDPGKHPFERIGYRRVEPGALPKIAARVGLPLTITQGNHEAVYPAPREVKKQLVVRHFPYRSAGQMTRKARNGAAAYAATDLPEDAGKHWRDYGRLTDEQLDEVFHTHFWEADPERSDLLTYDPAPEAIRAAN